MTTGNFDPVKYKENTRQQWQAAAKAWSEHGPVLHEWLGPATEKMLDMARVGPGSHVLDVAAGAGDQTLQIASRVGPKGHVLATDISSNILEYAKMNVHMAGFTNVETRVLDGENLELPESSFDAIVSRLGLMGFPHRDKALQGFHRVVKKNGTVGLIVFTVPENNEFFSIPISIIRRHANLPPPRPGQPGPFVLGGPKVLEQLFEQAGFKQIQEIRLKADLKMKNVEELIRFERESFGFLHTMMSSLSDEKKTEVWQEIRTAFTKFETLSGLVAPTELLVASATKQ